MHVTCMKCIYAHMWMIDVSYMYKWHIRHVYAWHMREWRISECIWSWMRHTTHIYKSCHKYEWVMPHIWMGHVIHMNGSCHTCEWAMPHMWMSHATHVNESCHTYEWVMPHMWMSHATHVNESCHTYEWVMPHIWKHMCSSCCLFTCTACCCSYTCVCVSVSVCIHPTQGSLGCAQASWSAPHGDVYVCVHACECMHTLYARLLECPSLWCLRALLRVFRLF